MSDLRPRLIQLAKAKKALRMKLEKEHLEGSLIEFYRAAWHVIDPAAYQDNWHLDAIAEHLEAVARGQIRKLCVNLPPRHSKTILCSVAFNAWIWCQKPDERYPLLGPGSRFMCLSYGDDLAMDNSVLTRRLIESPWYQERWGDRVAIHKDQDAKGKFDTTSGGTRISGSFRGTVTGRGAGIRVYDDPHKMDEVESQTQRERVLTLYNTTLKSRVNDPRTSAEVLVAQRGHQDDLSSVFLNDPETVHLNLPAEYDTTRHCVTSLGWEDPRTYDGELLWADRWGPKELAQYKLNPYEWAAQWQQQPTPRGGGLIHEEWFQPHEVRRGDGGMLRFIPEVKPLYVLASLDTAFSEKETADYSALTIWVVHEDPITKHRKILLADAWQKRLPELSGETVEREDGESEISWKKRQQAKWGLVEWVGYSCKRRRVNQLIIENKNRAPDVVRAIKRLFADRDFGVQAINIHGDKRSRASAIVDIFTDGMVHAPAVITKNDDVQFLDWASNAMQAICSYPHGSHDDLLDAMTLGLKYLRDNGWAIRKDEHKADELARSQHQSQRDALYPV